MSQETFDAWADEADVKPRTRIAILDMAVALIAQERDDMKALLLARGETEDSISAELELIEAGRDPVPSHLPEDGDHGR